jgi:hypothetical protein
MSAATLTGTSTFAGGVANAYGFGVGTAVPSSGAGITFPATQSASSDANTLDDYEEGTWTPAIDSETAGIGRVTNVACARYTKIGNLCSFQLQANLSTLGSGGSGVMVIRGLPFAMLNVTGYNPSFTVGYFYNSGAGGSLTAISAAGAGANQTYMFFTGSNGSSNDVLWDGNVTFSTIAATTLNMFVSGTYQTN